MWKVETVRELEIEPENVNELLPLSLKWFPEMDSTSDEDTEHCWNVKDLECHINSVDKLAAEFDRIDSSFDRRSIMDQIALHATEKSFMKGKLNLCIKFHCHFKKLPQPPQPSAVTTLISQ